METTSLNKNVCPDDEVALKSFFLGPQSENASWVLGEGVRMLERWFEWRRSLFPEDGRCISKEDQNLKSFLNQQSITSELLRQLAIRYEEETPKFSPRYIGHMLSEMSIPGILGHIQALLHNSNHASIEVSKASHRIEREAIEDLAKMVGFGLEARGHFCSGGTMANFEAVYRAIYRWSESLALSCALAKREGSTELKNPFQYQVSQITKIRKELKITKQEMETYRLFSSSWIDLYKRLREDFSFELETPKFFVARSKHYSWLKAMKVFGLGESALVQVPLTDRGVLCVSSLNCLLHKVLEKENASVALLVGIAGSTEMGLLDPLDRMAKLAQARAEQAQPIYFHIDAAYGGFFSSLKNKTVKSLSEKLKAFSVCDSITLDPHKLGYVPYSCGAFLCRSEESYQVPKTKASYLDMDLPGEDLWANTLEGSRAATGATATWLCSKSIGFNENGYGKILQKTMDATQELASRLQHHFGERIHILDYETNVLCFIFVNSPSLKDMNSFNQKIYSFVSKGKSFGISKTVISKEDYQKMIDSLLFKAKLVDDDTEVFLLRCVCMNPFLISKSPRVDYIDQFINYVSDAIEELC